MPAALLYRAAPDRAVNPDLDPARLVAPLLGVAA